ncbi:NepR family anti-sigma factor [Radicibacter daui]|uniref:NepR family anti-sigma factor n=1 Tax=Radicibacter daui TaxID=3064829 RepID=UPI00404704F0
MNPEIQPYSTQDAEGENPEAVMERANSNPAPGMTGGGSPEAAPFGAGQAGDGQAARLLEENGFHWLGGQLRDMYEEVVHEPLPGQFMDLLQKLDDRVREPAAASRPTLAPIGGATGGNATEGASGLQSEGNREEKH